MRKKIDYINKCKKIVVVFLIVLFLYGCALGSDSNASEDTSEDISDVSNAATTIEEKVTYKNQVSDDEVLKEHGDMKLVWHDEFNGAELDSKNWYLTPKMKQKDIINRTDEHNIMVCDGNLLMRSWNDDNSFFKYSTNTSCTTEGTMSFKYGYLEISAKVPYVRGAWPSFWMQSYEKLREANYLSEVDIFEVMSSESVVTSNLHKWYFDGDEAKEHFMLNPPGNTFDFAKKSMGAFGVSGNNIRNLNNEYHVYGFYWDNMEMTFYVDGKKYCTVDITENGEFGNGGMKGFHDPMFIIFNNFIFTDKSDWIPKGGTVNDDTEYPICFYVDYIRLYQKDGEGEIYR